MAHLFQINLNDGGVPKWGRPQAEIHALGLAGDRQRNTHVHGGPERAVCLYSLERLLALQGEGHPIFPGAIGENLTLAGVEWSTLAVGQRVRIGEQVLIELTKPTTPCDTLKPYFIEENFSRVSDKLHPGWARWYGRVLQPGLVRIGDLVTLL